MSDVPLVGGEPFLAWWFVGPFASWLRCKAVSRSFRWRSYGPGIISAGGICGDNYASGRRPVGSNGAFANIPPRIWLGSRLACSSEVFRSAVFLGLGHFRWKTSTDLRRQRGKAQKKPIHLTSLHLLIAVPPKVTKTRYSSEKMNFYSSINTLPRCFCDHESIHRDDRRFRDHVGCRRYPHLRFLIRHTIDGTELSSKNQWGASAGCCIY
jgi:hypothetical protein